MKGEKTERTLSTESFIHKLKCKYNKIKIETIDERLTTVQAHRTMNELRCRIKKKKKHCRYNISSVYIRSLYK